MTADQIHGLDVTEERFWSKVDLTLWCWRWTGAPSTSGYGQMLVDGSKRSAHRLAYELLVGPIPPGLVLDHLCRNRLCVNPLHLEPVSQSENIRRGVGIAAANHRKTHCAHGHPFDEANTYIRANGCRACRVCGRRPARRYRQARRTAA